jgi:hypothetical protein
MAQSTYGTLGIRLLWAAIVVGALEVLLNWVVGSFDLASVVVELFFFLIWGFLTAKVAAGQTWARAVYVIITSFVVLIWVLMTAMIFKIPGMPATVGLATLLMGWLPPILEVLGLLLLFGETSSGGKIGVVFLSAVIVVAGLATLAVPRMLSFVDQDPTFALMKTAMQIKQEHRFPVMVDEETEAFDVRAQRGTLVYYYRLVNVNANGFDARGYLDRVKPVVTERFCGQESQGLFKQGVVLRASYVDKAHLAIGSLDVNPGDCEAAAGEPAHHEVWKKYVPQSQAQPDAPAETPWRTDATAATASPTPSRRTQQNVETPEMKAQALVDDGNQQMQQGNYDAAIKDFRAALALQPNNYAARSGLQEAQHMR